MYLKILKKLCCTSNSGVRCKDILPDNIKIINVRHMAIWWGHDTLEDKAARLKNVEDSRVRTKVKLMSRKNLTYPQIPNSCSFPEPSTLVL